MKRKWKDKQTTEKIAAVMNGTLVTGMLLCTALYFLRIWPIGNDITWLLFILHYFVDALFLWKTDHDTAVRALCMGCFLALMLSLILLMYLLS